MSDIRFEGWLHRSGTGGVYQDSAGNVGIASTQPQTRLDIGNGGFQVGPTGIATVTTVNTTNLINATPLTNRNVIVNGAMQVAQRGTSSTSSGMGCVDRMKMSVTNTDELAFTQTQGSDGPDGFKKCFQFDVTTAESALAVDELVYVRYGIEAQDLVSFYNANGSGKNFTLSFYVKAYQAGTYQVSIYKDDNGTRFITKTYTIDASGTWQRVVLNFTGDTGNYPVNADNGLGFWLDFKLAAGTNYTSGGQVASWGSFSNSVFAAGQAVNVLSSTNNYWKVTGIQLELGSVATPFEHRSFGDELARCQRYCELIVRGASKYINNSVGYTSNNLYAIIRFAVEKRTTPTLSHTSGSEYYQNWHNGTGTDLNGFTGVSWPNKQASAIYATSTIDAKEAGLLGAKNASAEILFLAEL